MQPLDPTTLSMLLRQLYLAHFEQRHFHATGQVPDDTRHAHRDADDEVRPDRPGRRLADVAEERREPQRAQDQPDEAAEESDQRYRDDGDSNIRARGSPRLDGAPRPVRAGSE